MKISMLGGVEQSLLPMDAVKASIRTSYESAAPDYARYADPLVFRFVTDPLAVAVESLGGPVLDVASGTGALARRLPGCVAVDIASAQLRENSALSKVQADAERLPFRDDSFAVAVCAFGINHFPDPHAAVREMARVAPVVGLITWRRPEVGFQPKEIVKRTISRYQSGSRPLAGEVVEQMTQALGSESAMRHLLRACGLDPVVRTEVVDVPWPGPTEFVEYRLCLPTALVRSDRDCVRSDAVGMISALAPEALRWRPQLIVALGRRSSP